MLKDPPFIRIDLIICRNLLIHLDQHQQQQLCAVLHYALKSDGYLFWAPRIVPIPRPSFSARSIGTLGYTWRILRQKAPYL